MVVPQALDAALAPVSRKLDSIMKVLPASRDGLLPIFSGALEQLRNEVVDALRPASGSLSPPVKSHITEQVSFHWLSGHADKRPYCAASMK